MSITIEAKAVCQQCREIKTPAWIYNPRIGVAVGFRQQDMNNYDNTANVFCSSKCLVDYCKKNGYRP